MFEATLVIWVHLAVHKSFLEHVKLGLGLNKYPHKVSIFHEWGGAKTA